MRRKRLPGWQALPLVLGLGTACLATAGELYRCERQGQIVFSDAPCGADAQPYQPPPATTVAPVGEGDLLEAAEARAQREQEANRRARQADAEWVEDQQARRLQEARIRKAVVEGRITEGMNGLQVRQVLGEPDSIERRLYKGIEEERWLYQRDGARQTVVLRDGRVVSARGRQDKN
ncbi:MAG TPA: DUF4124 domain-containing protein [Nevskiaceae bacterium]|nr:DUF4124 domain-containing protein [Nevskiaceae bacterium]